MLIKGLIPTVAAFLATGQVAVMRMTLILCCARHRAGNCVILWWILRTAPGGGIVTFPFYRCRNLAQGHMADKWEAWDLNPGSWTHKLKFFRLW